MYRRLSSLRFNEILSIVAIEYADWTVYDNSCSKGAPQTQMELNIGKRLGPYEIISRLGAGGMGEVYRARDSRLDRIVAVKILSSHLSQNHEMRQRFEREARAISSLSHSNICALYDVGHEDGIDYLVMEFVDGESLAERLSKGPLPVDQVLRYAIQIADALDKAHRNGIVHRDLKPGNVMITKSGAKLLDFGLAKLEDGNGSSASGLSNVATERVSLTGEGTILGTFQYMAPEQLEGQTADSRTDIFAFGAVVYEMATGKKAFTGKSQASLIGAILRDDPPTISTSQSMTPPSLDRLVKTCLAKDPEDRWQSAHDLSQELRWIAEGGSQAGSNLPITTKAKTRERTAWIIAAVVGVIAIVLGISALIRPAAPAPQVLRFTVSPPEKSTISESSAISPDGRFLTFTANDVDGKKNLWLRSLDSLVPKLLSGTEGAEFPFWSPDSRSIGFFAENKLKKIDVSGGRPQNLCDVSSSPRGGSWSNDGTIIFTPNFTTPLYKIPAAGGTPAQVTELDSTRSETTHRWPTFLPDGRRFLYYVGGTADDTKTIFVGSLDSPQKTRLFDCDSRVVYASNEAEGKHFLLFVRDKSLMAQSFDIHRLTLTGEIYRLADEVEVFGETGPTGYVAFSVSTDGTLAYRGSDRTDVQFVMYDRTSKQSTTLGVPGTYAEPCLSPDFKRIVFVKAELQPPSSDIWLLDIARSTPTRFTFSPSREVCPLWSPDGSRIVYSVSNSGQEALYQKDSAGVGKEELLLQTGSQLYADDWSRDGRYLIFESADPKTKFDLWILPMTGDRKPYPFLRTDFNETHSQISPDGRWVAYVSDESGRAEVYIQSFAPSGGKWQISTGGGDQPKWRQDGKELFYISSARRLMAVSISPTMGSAIEAGIPVQLFELFVPTRPLTGDRNDYVVMENGQKFIVCSFVDREKARPIAIVSNRMTTVKAK